MSQPNILKIFNPHPVSGHFFSMWSKAFIVAPHLSGFEFCAQIVTLGKVSSSIGNVMVSSTVTVGLSYQTGKANVKEI